MLRLIPPAPPLTPAEQFALDTIVDLSRILLADAGEGIVLHVRSEGGPTPTIAEARGRQWCIEPRDGVVTLQRPLLSLVADIAGATQEQRTDAADRYGRVPPTENALVRTGDERDPVVGRIAAALRSAAIASADRRPLLLLAPWPNGKRWAMAMSHDLDVVSAWPVFTGLRLAELARKGDIARATSVAASALASIGRDPVWRAARRLLDTERAHGVRSTWFIIAGTPTLATMSAGDITYAPESSLARRIMGAAAEDGHELGLHGSFAAFVSRETLAEQRARLAAITGATVGGVRQHFLRMRPGVSHVAMAGAGFGYDSTFGFSERNGFRLGVADVVPVWDDRNQRVLDLQEAPFVWMDRALSKYRGIEDPAAWIDDALAIARACREVDGLWTGVWHPNLDPALGYPGAPLGFDSLLSGLLAHSPWAATLGEIVQWRRARRTVRAVAVVTDSSGPVRLRVPIDAPGLALEDADGRPVPYVRV